MAFQDRRTRAHLRRLKLMLVEAIFTISDHERGYERGETRRAEDRWKISALFRLRFELQDMLLQLHLIESLAGRDPSGRAAALVAAATRSARLQLSVMKTATRASLGAKQLIAIILELRADLEMTRDAAICG